MLCTYIKKVFTVLFTYVKSISQIKITVAYVSFFSGLFTLWQFFVSNFQLPKSNYTIKKKILGEFISSLKQI